jgi:hypothetical protein
VAAAAWLVLGAGAAHAQSVHWRAPAGCPSEAQVQRAVQRGLADAPTPVDASAIAVEARVDTRPAGYALALRLSTPAGASDQQLTAADCRTLADAVALQVALSAGPAWAPEPVPRRLSLRVAGSYGAQLLPGAGPWLMLAGALGWSGFALELDVGYGFAGRARYADRQDLGARVDALQAGARLCAEIALGSVGLPLCAGAELGLMRGTGLGAGLARSLTSTQPYVALVLHPALRWPLSRQLAIWLGFELLGVLERPTFQVRGAPQLFRPEPLAVRAGVALEWRVDGP